MKYFFHFLLLSAILTACSSTQPTKNEIPPGATASKHVLENPGVVVNT